VAATLRHDVVFAVRLLRKSPAFTVAAILTVALAVGVNASVFSVVNAFMVRPLPVADGQRLVVIATHRGASGPLGGVSYPDLQDYRMATRHVFEDITAYNVGFAGIRRDAGRAERVLATWVTGNYFSLLRLQPHLGRLFTDDEGRLGRADALVVLGYSTWQRRFRADASIIGKAVAVNGKPCTIVGVAPPGFSGVFAFSESELYLPVNWSAAAALQDRGPRWLHAIGRIRPGAASSRHRR
jgi:hypothetical protein